MAIVDLIVPSYGGLSGTFQKHLMEMIVRSHCRCGTHPTWQCDRGKHSLYVQPHVDSCVVHWSRNTLVSTFLHAPTVEGRPLADYCLMLDDDILLTPGDVERLLTHRKDIVVGICTKRADPPKPTIRQWNVEEGRYVEIVEWNWQSQKIFEVDGSGAACMLVKRGVLERMRDAYLDCFFEKLVAPDKDFSDVSAKRRAYYEKAVREGDWQRATCWWFEFMWDPSGNERGEIGEDLSFCWKVKKLGFKIWADPQVLPGHLGDYAYSARDYIYFRETEKQSILPRGEESDGTEPQLKAAAVN